MTLARKGMEKRNSENLLEEQACSVAESIFSSPSTPPMPDPTRGVVGVMSVDPMHAVETAFKNMTVGPSAKPLTPRASNAATSTTVVSRPNPHVVEYKNDLESFEEDPSAEYPISLCSLFIGDLARSVTEDQIREVFSRYGEVVKVDIKRDKVTHNNLGYGFLQYRTPAQACAGKDALNGAEISNRKVRIGWAQKNTTLFVGDLDGTVNTELLRDIFGEYGELVEDETFVKPGVGKFGFVRFKNRADAEKAKVGMSRKVIGSRSIRIGWGDNNVQKHCVHVQFNPTGADGLSEERLHSAFRVFGPVDSVSLPRHSNTGRLKGYCFIHFEDSEDGEKAAAKAISDMSAGVIDDVVVRSSYAKRHGFNKRRNKSPTGGSQPAPQMFNPMAVPNMQNNMFNPKNFSRPNDERFQNGMMPIPNPYFVPAVNPLGFVQAVAMQNMQQGYLNQFPKFNGHPASFQFQNSNGQGFQGVPDFPNQMRGQMLPPRHQQNSPQMYQERSFPEQGFEAYSPHLGPAHMMSPQLYGSPVISQVPPLHMAPSMSSYLPPNGYYNTHAH